MRLDTSRQPPTAVEPRGKEGTTADSPFREPARTDLVEEFRRAMAGAQGRDGGAGRGSLASDELADGTRGRETLSAADWALGAPHVEQLFVMSHGDRVTAEPAATPFAALADLIERHVRQLWIGDADPTRAHDFRVMLQAWRQHARGRAVLVDPHDVLLGTPRGERQYRGAIGLERG